VDGAAHRGVEQGREHAAVDDAERVLVLLAQLEREAHGARCRLDGRDAERT
jgi:hypothetical protein